LLQKSDNVGASFKKNTLPLTSLSAWLKTQADRARGLHALERRLKRQASFFVTGHTVTTSDGALCLGDAGV